MMFRRRLSYNTNRAACEVFFLALKIIKAARAHATVWRLQHDVMAALEMQARRGLV